MHIAFITSEYPHPQLNITVGGIGSFTKNIAEALINKGIKVTIFLTSQESNKIINEDITIHSIKKKKFICLSWYANRKYTQNYINKVSISERIDIIEAPEWTGITAFMKFKIPLVIRLHGSDTYFCHLENRKVRSKNKFLENKALLSASKIIGVSNFVANKTKELFNLKSEIDVIHNAISTNIFLPNHQDVKPNSLLYFGTIIRKKGVLEIAKAFNKVIELNEFVFLCLLGSDSEDYITNKSTLAMFKDLLSEKALKNFTYIDAVPYQEVISYIQKSEVVLLPSFAEAFPMTWLEAMALEKKLVTSNIGWANELMINNQTGYTIDPKDVNDFAFKILDLLNNEKNALKMAKKARNRIIKEFDMNQSIKKSIKLYENLIDNFNYFNKF